MKPWSHLPNAALIDWVIKSLKNRPELWDAASDADRIATRLAARTAVLNAVRDATRLDAWYATRYTAWNAARTTTRDAARDAVWDVLAALIAYDDCDGYLSMSYEHLHTWAILSETPQAVLLLPMKWVQENSKVSEIQ